MIPSKHLLSLVSSTLLPLLLVFMPLKDWVEDFVY
ncbi:hypothetical protein MEQ_01499 [Candida albicans P87]|nr:hypothetical protein MEU_01508 [Candida albicans P37005]KGU12258.1 hypothetical protein MEQ_01499 [Candida albicans P87]